MSSDTDSALHEGPEDDVAMSFFDHLNELRKRLIRAALALAVGITVCYVAVDQLTQFILWPYHRAWTDVNARCMERDGAFCLPDGGPQLQNLTAYESVLTDIRIAVIGGIFLVSPVLFHQLWLFVSPGLYRKEKRLVVPFVLVSVIMFLAGGAFCYTYVLPIATDFLLEYPLRKSLGDGVRIVTNYTYSDYVKYTTQLLVAFGAMFEFPLGVFFLAKTGVVTHLTLLKYWKPMVLVFFIVGAILTPPEPITQILMAVPMTLLYFASTGVAYFASKEERERVARLEAELGAQTDDDDDEDEEQHHAPGPKEQPRLPPAPAG